MAAKFLAGAWLGFLCGVGIGSWYELDKALISIIVSAVLLMACAGIISGRGVLVLCVVLGLGFGFWRIQGSLSASEYGSLFGQQYEAEGVIAVDPPDVEQSQAVTFIPDGHQQAIRAILYQPIVAQRGDRVWIRGTLAPPENFSDFDYIGYLQRYNIYAVLKKPRVIVVKRAPLSWRSPPHAAKVWFLSASRQKFEPKPGSLIVGMLIGERGRIPKEVTDSFARTGLSHIVAVSGFNMTILAAGCASLAWYLGRRLTNYLTISAIASFVVITGASASVVRAAIMALLVVGAQLFGRRSTSSYALVWAAGLMVLQNPRILAWDIGFQLSMVATAGVLSAIWWQIHKPATLLKASLLPTCGAIVATAPLIAYYFHTASLVAPLANGLLLPLVPALMLLGALSFVPLVGGGMAFGAGLLSDFFLGATKVLASWNHSSIELHVTATGVVIYYLFLVGLLQLKAWYRRVVN